MRGYTRVVLMGNMVHDPQLKATPQGKPMLSVAVAVNETRGSGAERKETVHYFDVAMFGKTAENVAAYKHKGDPLLVSGTLAQSRWEDNAGKKRSKVGVIAQEVHFLPRGNGARGDHGAEVPAAVGEVFPGASMGEEEIPF